MFGKFRILRLLGAGGMGRVFLAENQMLRRQVALKVLPKKLVSHPTALDRFHQEARALARLNHNNIVRVYDVDALLAAGLFAMQISSSDSTLTTTDPTQTSTAASAANFSAGTFYVVGNNRTYHTKECQHLQGKDNTRQVTQRMLDAGYLKPCRTCRPGSK